MAITYPISLPSSPPPARLVLRRRDIVGATESIFTGQVQVHKHQGEWWEAEVILPPLTRAEAAQWDAAIESLRGSYGTFLLGDASRTTAQGTPVGSPAVDGASQTGTQLATKNWNGVAQGVNMGFEAGAADWAGSWTISNDPANARTGSWVASVVSDGSFHLFENQQFPAIEGDRVTASAWGKGVGTDGTFICIVTWLDSGGTGITQSESSPISGTGAYASVAVEGIAPATTAAAELRIRSEADNTTGTWYADDCSITHYSAATGLLLPGDYIQLGSGTTQRLHRVLTQVDCDQTGAATLDIWPRLRESPADGELLVLTNPQGVFRLAGPTEVERLPGGFTRLSFRCREAI